MTTRASYRDAVEWIARDTEAAHDFDDTVDRIALRFVAELFRMPLAKVTADVEDVRTKDAADDEQAEADARDYAATESTKWRREL